MSNHSDTFNVSHFSLDAIARSGQVFTWRKLGNQHYLVASGERRCHALQRGDTLTLSTPEGESLSHEDLSYWRHYFALDDDYAAILHELTASGALTPEMQQTSAGIRVLHQDWWDTIISFVISQNSNIKRIQKTVNLLMDHGAPKGTIPRPSRLLELFQNPEFLSKLKLGYREKYVVGLTEEVVQGWEPLSLLRPLAPLSDQFIQLQELPGVGPKVASCICLYGLGYANSVPRDVWIKRAEAEHNVSWHDTLGGIQQQFVFDWVRQKSAHVHF